MNDMKLRKELLAVLVNLDGIAVRETILASEAEIRVGHPLTKEAFDREIKELIGQGLVKRDFDAFNEASYTVTGDGKAAFAGRR